MNRLAVHLARHAFAALPGRCAWAVVVTCAMLLPLAAPLLAQSTQPAGRFEGQPVLTARDAAESTSRPAISTKTIPPIRFDWQRVALALAIVLALIALLRFAGKRFFAGNGVSLPGKTIRVLGRATTGPRQQVVLLQVGKRIVVAADNGGQLATLCQITEADEVAALLGQLEESHTVAPKTPFTNWFRKASDDFEPETTEQLAPAGAAMEDPSLETARGEIASLMDRVRALTRQVRK